MQKAVAFHEHVVRRIANVRLTYYREVSRWYLIQEQPPGCDRPGCYFQGEGRYLGYKITQDVRSVLEVSESTLYPVLRRLQKDECLEAYNMEYAGRNRKYYKLTDKGAAQLNLYRSEWEIYSSKITRMFEEGV